MNRPTPKHWRAENDRLRWENERLRQRLTLRDGRHVKRLQRAYDAGLALAALHVAYLDVTRAQAQAAGVLRFASAGTTHTKTSTLTWGNDLRPSTLWTELTTTGTTRPTTVDGRRRGNRAATKARIGA